jgi:hypothetical protein
LFGLSDWSVVATVKKRINCRLYVSGGVIT